MSLGSSKSLKEALASTFELTKIDAESLLKFFEPLTNWLKKENERTGEYVGWILTEEPGESQPKQVRRKRSIEDYSSESRRDG